MRCGSPDRMPVLLEHKREHLIGLVTKCDIVQAIAMKAKFFDTPSACQVREASKNGFEYQASIGFEVNKIKYVGKGESYQCNGKTFLGPITVITESTLEEVSCVLWGRDSTTSVKMSKDAEEFIMSKRPAELAELRQEFSDANFVLECIDKGWSMDEARKEHFAREKAKLDADRLKLAAEQKALADQIAADRAKLEAERAELGKRAPVEADPVPIAGGSVQLNAPNVSITMRAVEHKPCAEPFATEDDMKFYELYGGTAVVHGKFSEEKKIDNFEHIPW